MSKLVVIHLGHGDLEKGFEQVTAQLWEVGNSLPEQFIGSLPPAPDLAEIYKKWQLSYLSLCTSLRSCINDDYLEIDDAGITNVSDIDFNQLGQELRQYLNNWFKSVEFLNIDRKLRSALNPTEEIRVIIETNHILLRRSPWYCWDFFDDYPCAEMALSQLEYQHISNSREPKFPRQKVRILAVLGNSQNIDLEAEANFLENLQDAQVEFLVKPSRTTFNNYLWDSEGWDILFFAGHSKTEGETGRIYINENDTDNSLTIEQLKEALKQAIGKGLKLAIFNSCDGLGLADELQRLHIPTVIVMREPVQNLVAQEFFQYFLQYFAIEQLCLYLSVKQARKKLQGLENEFPGASWLPVICQNPGVAPPSWLDLGRRPTKINPYRGLFAFREEDAGFFFGREIFTQMLVNAVQNQPLVAVVGSSGSGKSSVVFAGLVKQLRDTGDWHIIDFRPGSRPLFNLATALVSQRVKNQPTERLREIRNLATDLQEYEKCLRDVVDDICENSNRRFLLVADQFEELYTLCRDLQERKAFLDRLLEAINHCTKFCFVITLRADFLGQALSYRPFADALQYADIKLGPMTNCELQATVEKPAALLGVTIEERLTERILKKVSAEPGDLALLEFALTQLWSKQQDARLTHAAYDEIGGVEAALAHYASQAYDQLNHEEKERAQRIFIQLVHPGLGTEDTRRLATRREVGEENWDLVARLADARLVVTGYDEKAELETVEIVHEALIRNWGQLQRWMHQDRDFRHWQEQLRVAMRTWESSNFDEGALLRGKPLTDAEHWQSQRFLELSPVERSFIGLSVEFRERESKNKKRRRKLILFGLSTGLLAALSLAGMAWWQWQNSVKNEIKALSVSSEAFLSSNNDFDALIASIKLANRIQKTFSVDANTRIQLVETLLQAVNFARERNRLENHRDTINDIAFSPDGNLIATASKDKTVIIWSKQGKQLETLQGHQGDVKAVTFSPDGKIIASGSADKTAKLWNKDGKEINTLKGHQGEINSISFSPDGNTIATASGDKTVIIWSLDGKKIITLNGHEYGVFGVSFSPDGNTIATASGDKTVKLWSKEGKELQTYKHEGGVNSVTFSPDGKYIATGGWDKAIALWTIEGKKIRSFPPHDDTINQLSFSPDGKMIASASSDKTAKLWSIKGQLLDVFSGHDIIVSSIAFSPDGKTIATGSWDKTAKLWNVDNKELQILRGHQQAVWSVVFSPDGNTIASASEDKTVKLWNRDGDLPIAINGDRKQVYDVSFSPDGKTIAIASEDKTAKLWSRDGNLLKTLRGHTGEVHDVSFSPDGNIIATASVDKTVKLWNRDGKVLKTLTGHEGEVKSVKFSPDGNNIATSSWDNTVKVWNRDGKVLKTLPEDNDGVKSLAFSPDSNIIAIAGWDNTVRLWDWHNQQIKTLGNSSDIVNSIVFSPDGNIIATASRDKTIKLRRRDGTLLTNLHGHDDAVLSIDFSPDGQSLVSGSADKTVILWNLYLEDLKPLLTRGCTKVRDYLQNNPNVSQEDRSLCNGV
jgi:WD40 repeat protein